MKKNSKTVINKIFTAILTAVVIFMGIFTGSYTINASKSKQPTQQAVHQKTQNPDTNAAKKNSQNTVITSKQADKMALELTDKIWIWDWVKFYVPYMSAKGVKKLLPASRNSQWAGSIDMTTGKKLKFTKKQINVARKKKPSKSLTCSDIDEHALLIMQSNGDWECISFMLPHMTHKGIRAVVRCYNSKHGEKEKKAKDYY